MRRNLCTIGRVLVALLLFGAISGCSGIEPWVKPYERDRLADPIMALDGDPVSSSYLVCLDTINILIIAIITAVVINVSAINTEPRLTP